MTIQTTETNLDIDIAALVGEMEAPACEHPQHGRPGYAHDDGPATHYAHGFCLSCGYDGPVKPVCSAFVAHVKANIPIRCRICKILAPASQRTKILGPVNA